MKLQSFEKQQYMNIETFRRNGQGVKTPVWFTKDGETLLIWTQADSGKAKRIRRESRVRVVPSTASGEPLGEWTEARAVVDESHEAVQHTITQFKRKYGFAFNMFRLLGRASGRKYTAIKVQLN